jgi:hypothetical protein
MLVLDANVARAACGGDDDADGFAVFGDELVSVPLMWSEARASRILPSSKARSAEKTARSSTNAWRIAPSTASSHVT